MTDMQETTLGPIRATLDHLTDAGLHATDGRPTATPYGPYVIVSTDSPTDSLRGYDATAQRDVLTIRVIAVSRDRAICREIAQQADRALNGWRPTPDPSTSPWRRIDGGPMLTDGPVSDIRHSITTVYRAHVPR